MRWERMTKHFKPMSLRFRLTCFISLAALSIWLISTAVAWYQVRKEVNDVFDAQQILFAQRLASSDLQHLLTAQSLELKEKKKKLKSYDDDALAFAIFTESGHLLLSDGNNGENFIFAPNPNQFSKARLQNDDDEWRIFWLPEKQSNLVIAVGQEIEFRQELVSHMILGQMWICFASLPFLLTIIIWTISRELRNLKNLSQQLRARTPEDNRLLPTQNIPKEIMPLVQNLNQFFERTSTILLRERRFTSDAAHELRSPLAALRVQTELAQLADDDEIMRHKALTNLIKGIDRANQLVEQLLTLSRLDNLKQLDDLESVAWEKLIPSLIAELYFSAQKRQIELIFEQQGIPPLKQGKILLISLLLRNLIDNAIRYCPMGCVVKIILQQDRLIVEDNGNGVESSALDKLGQRFYRPAGQNEKGSGLGLSIVHRIADLHHYQVSFENVMNEQQQICGFRAIVLL